MVNAGKRSKCCFTCRERRVKCDFQKPTCRRCAEAGRQCKGYPETWGVMIRMQNDYAKSRVQTRVERAQRRRTDQAREQVPSIPRGVLIAAEIHGWNRFYSDYVVDSGIVVFSVLPKFYTNEPSSCALEAIEAVVLASCARQLHQSGLMARARRHYGRAMRMINVALNDTTLTGDDSILITLFLFSFYEIISQEYCPDVPMDRAFKCSIHFQGALRLLQWRAKHACNSALDQSVFAFYCHISLMSMFVNYVPSDLKWSVLEDSTNPWANRAPLEPIVARAVKFKRSAQGELTATVHQSSTLEVLSFVEEGISIGQGLEAAVASVELIGLDLPPGGQQPTA